ncbi:MAG: hypothetical protein AB8C13_06060 [Phycisphaerales bacterium]
MNLIQKIRDTETKLRSESNPVRQMESWALLERLMGRMPVDQAELARICKERDAIGLDVIISRLEDPDAFKQHEEPLPEFTQSELNDAMRAFRHRIKYKKLDDESRISQRNLTGGKKAQIESMQPPGASEFDPKIWKVMAKNGMLVDDGGGFYHEPEKRA